MPSFDKFFGERRSRTGCPANLLQAPAALHTPAFHFPIERALDPLELGLLRGGRKPHG